MDTTSFKLRLEAEQEQLVKDLEAIAKKILRPAIGKPYRLPMSYVRATKTTRLTVLKHGMNDARQWPNLRQVINMLLAL